MWLLLINPFSGNSKGRQIGQIVKNELKLRSIAYKDISESDSFNTSENLRRELAREEKYEGLFLVGGDGTLFFALQELAGSKTPIALIPAGTGNDFARSLGLELSNPAKLLDRYLSTLPSLVDMGKVNDCYFLNVLSTGFDSVVNERANRMRWIKGRAKYNLAMLLVLATFHPKKYKFTFDGISMEQSAILIAVSNGRSYGGGMKVTPEARIDDGLFDVLILAPISRAQFLRFFPKVFKGTHITHPAVKIIRAKKIEISSDAIAYADGERIGALPISASVIEASLLTWRM